MVMLIWDSIMTKPHIFLMVSDIVQHIKLLYTDNLAMQLDLKLEDFNHPNLIRLLGYCSHWGEFYCLYELIPGTSLDKYLLRETGKTSLSWVRRLKIAVGAAQGLAFLHKRKHPAYRQLKMNHIFVDTVNKRS